MQGNTTCKSQIEYVYYVLKIKCLVPIQLTMVFINANYGRNPNICFITFGIGIIVT